MSHVKFNSKADRLLIKALTSLESDHFEFCGGTEPDADLIAQQTREIRSALLKGANPNVEIRGRFDYCDALVYAVYSGNCEGIKLLVEAGADLTKEKSGWSALSCALYAHHGAADTLLQLGASLDIKAPSNTTYPEPKQPFVANSELAFWAAGHKNLENDLQCLPPLLPYLDEALLNEGVSADRFTLLMSAAGAKNVDPCKLIVEHPLFSNINYQDAYGNTAAHHLAFNYSQGDISKIKAIMELFIDQGLDFSILNAEGLTALQFMQQEFKKREPSRQLQDLIEEVIALDEQLQLNTVVTSPTKTATFKRIL